MTGLVLTLGAADRIGRLPEGFHGSYFLGADIMSVPSRSTIEGNVSTEALTAAWNGSPPEAFSATWEGSFLVIWGGPYVLGAASDNAFWIYVDGYEVVNNGKHQGTQLATGTIRLTPGVHSIVIRYAHEGGLPHLEVLWGKRQSALRPIESSAFTVGKPSAPRFLLNTVLTHALPAAEWLWVVTLVSVGGWLVWPQARSLDGRLRQAKPTLSWSLLLRRPWVGVALIAMAGIAIRLAYLSHLRTTGFAAIDTPAWWTDPDGYLDAAQSLTASGHWAWTFKAVACCWAAQSVVLPPGYPVFLSLLRFGQSPSPEVAALVHCALGGVEVVSLYVLANALHNERAGLIAAGLGAVWFPSITSVTFMQQEHLFIPAMLAGLATVAWCLTQRAHPGLFLLSGTIWAVAALTRPQPLYFSPVLLALIATWPGARKWRWGGLAGYAAGFFIPVIAYVLFISHAKGTLVLIDNHAAAVQTWSIQLNQHEQGRFTTMVRALAEQAVWNWRDRATVARLMFHLSGPAWLASHGASANATTAFWTGWFAHVGLDLLFVILTIAAPIGLAVAQRPRVATLLAAWALAVIGVSALAGFAGGRYRMPLEVVVICGGATAVARPWRRPARVVLVGGIAAAVFLAGETLPQLRTSFAAQAPLRPAMTPSGHEARRSSLPGATSSLRSRVQAGWTASVT
jgi:hypothetical protein